MAAGIHLSGDNETIDLQQQVARLQALLEASRQVHSTIREEAVLGAVLRIVVRELEMAGAAFPEPDSATAKCRSRQRKRTKPARFPSTCCKTARANGWPSWSSPRPTAAS